MTERTITHTIESDAQPDTILSILADASRLPEWASAFADHVERDGTSAWKVTKGGNAFALEVVVEPSSRTVDYLREIAPGIKGGAFLRVLPLPGGGSVVVMTLPVPPGQTTDAVAVILRQELESLVTLSV
jgi:hypothetical protein